jgi:hypothetical protein
MASSSASAASKNLVVTQFIRKYVPEGRQTRAMAVAAAAAGEPQADAKVVDALRRFTEQQTKKPDSGTILASTHTEQFGQGLPTLDECPVGASPIALPKGVRRQLRLENKDVPSIGGNAGRAYLAKQGLSEESHDVVCVTALNPSQDDIQRQLFQSSSPAAEATTDLLEVVDMFRRVDIASRRDLVRAIANTYSVTPGTDAYRALEALSKEEDVSTLTPEQQQAASKAIHEITTRMVLRKTGQADSQDLNRILRDYVQKMVTMVAESDERRRVRESSRETSKIMGVLGMSSAEELPGAGSGVLNALLSGGGDDMNDDDLEQVQREALRTPAGQAMHQIAEKLYRGEARDARTAARQLLAEARGEALEDVDESESRQRRRRGKVHIDSAPRVDEFIRQMQSKGVLTPQAVAVWNEFLSVYMASIIVLGQVQVTQQMLLMYYQMQSTGSAAEAYLEAASGFYLVTKLMAGPMAAVTFRGANFFEPPRVVVGEKIEKLLHHPREPEWDPALTQYGPYEVAVRNSVRNQIATLTAKDPRTGIPLMKQLSREDFDQYRTQDVVLTACTGLDMYYARDTSPTLTEVQMDGLFALVRNMGMVVSLPQQQLSDGNVTTLHNQILVLVPETRTEVEILNNYFLKPGDRCMLNGRPYKGTGTSAPAATMALGLSKDTHLVQIMVFPAATIWQKEGTQVVTASPAKITALEQAVTHNDSVAVEKLNAVTTGYVATGRHIPRVVVTLLGDIARIARASMAEDDHRYLDRLDRALRAEGGVVDQNKVLAFVTANLAQPADSNAFLRKVSERGSMQRLKQSYELYHMFMSLLYNGVKDDLVFRTNPGLIPTLESVDRAVRDIRLASDGLKRARIGQFVDYALDEEKKLAKMMGAVTVAVATFVVNKQTGQLEGYPPIANSRLKPTSSKGGRRRS